MAAGRAADLTEAYRILSHEGQRAEYDVAFQAGHLGSPVAVWPAPSPDSATTPEPTPTAPASGGAASTPPGQSSRAPDAAGSNAKQFADERATRDAFVRKATMNRFRQACTQVAGSGYDDSKVPGFDVACVPKAKLFGRNKGPRLLGRYVARVDAAAVADAWGEAGKWHVPAGEAICIILMGSTMAPPRELADAIAEQRRRPSRGAKVTLIPVDASVWQAHMPTDAPAVAKDLLARLRNA